MRRFVVVRKHVNLQTELLGEWLRHHEPRERGVENYAHWSPPRIDPKEEKLGGMEGIAATAKTVRHCPDWRHMHRDSPTAVVESWRKPLLEVAIALGLGGHPSLCRVEKRPGVTAFARLNGVCVSQRLLVAGSGVVLEVP